MTKARLNDIMFQEKEGSEIMKIKLRNIMPDMKAKNCIFLVLGGASLAFGLFNVHSLSGITEGGSLGLTLLLDHWFRISPAVSSFILNAICYFIGWRTFGKDFIAYSAVCSISFSLFYWIFELIGPIYPAIADYRIIAAIIGAVFVGVGVGLCVRFGGAPCGDDALAMSLANYLKIDIKWTYMISDIAIILLSLTYIPFKDILYSLLTVVLSSNIVSMVQKIGKKK